jgi:glyoxylate reductase
MMAKPKVFITRQIHQEALDLIGAEADMEVWPDEAPPIPQVLRAKASDVQGILTNIMDGVDTPFFEGSPHLSVVSQLAVGTDNIDLAAATQRGIPVGHTPGVLAKATADLTFALILAAARRVVESDRWVREGQWALAFHPLHWLGTDVSEATLGIVGLGQTGIEVARRARGFDMELLYYSRSRKPDAEVEFGMTQVELSELLRRSDFVSLHCPLTPQTHHLIGRQEMEIMKPTAILVNVARGPVVDTAALYTALVEGQLAAAALDVTEPEPIALDNPLLTLHNVVVTPHIGSAGDRGRRAMAMLAARNLVAGIAGEPLERCANPEVYAD